MAKSQKPSGSSKWVFVVFGGIFVLFGLGLLGAGFREIVRGWQSSSWPLADGIILNSSVETRSTSDGTSYTVDLSYRFVIDQRGHTGDKLAFGGRPGGYSGAWGIANRYPVGKPVKVAYHPRNPDLCVLEPGPRASTWLLPFFGLIALFLGSVTLKIFLLDGRNQKTGPGTEPWEHRRWRGDLARHAQGWGVCFHFFMASMFCGVGIGMLIWIPRAELAREKFLWLFIAMFSLVGLSMLTWAFICLARWLRFHACQVRMQTMPGVIGGHFAGEVTLPGSFPDDADVRLELLCEASTFSPGKGNQESSTSVSTEWSRKLCVRSSARRQGGHQGGVPFDFIIPYGLQDETDETRSEKTGNATSYKWHLRVMAELPGADLDIKFHVPVFKTAASDRHLTQVPEAGADLPLEKYLDEQGEKQRIRIEAGHNGPVYVGGITPVIWSSFLLIGVFALIFGGAGIGLLVAGPQRMVLKDLHVPTGIGDALFMLLPMAFIIIPTFIGLVCSGLGALFLAIALKEFISRRTWVANGTVYQSRRFLGIPLPTLAIPCNQVSSVGVGSSSSSGGKSFSDVTIAFRKNGQSVRGSLLKTVLGVGTITVATSIPTRRETDAVINALRNNINQQRNAPIAEDGEEEPENAGSDK
jgi:hypothetical protein